MEKPSAQRFSTLFFIHGADMICEHCGTALNCHTCSAIERHALISRGAALEKSRLKFIFISGILFVLLLVSIGIIYPNLSAKIPFLGTILANRILKPPKIVRQEWIVDNLDDQAEIAPEEVHAYDFFVFDHRELIRLKVNVQYQRETDNPLILYLIDQPNYQKFSNGSPFDPIHKTESVIDFYTFEPMAPGQYYILFSNPTKYPVMVNIVFHFEDAPQKETVGEKENVGEE